MKTPEAVRCHPALSVQLDDRKGIVNTCGIKFDVMHLWVEGGKEEKVSYTNHTPGTTFFLVILPADLRREAFGQPKPTVIESAIQYKTGHSAEELINKMTNMENLLIISTT